MTDMEQLTPRQREPLRLAAMERFGSTAKRNRWILSQHVINGRSLRAIAAEVGISSSRAAEIYHREVRKQKRWAEQYHPTSPYLGRPIDMGGPRDVWLTFYPSPDPRFDNMEPATGE